MTEIVHPIPYKMFIWRDGINWIVIAHAKSIAEARQLAIDESGAADDSSPIRKQALEAVQSAQPCIYYGANCEFLLTDSGQLQEADQYVMTQGRKISTLEATIVEQKSTLTSTLETVAMMAGMKQEETWGYLEILTRIREMRERLEASGG